MAIRFVEVGAEKAAPGEAKPRPEPPRPAADDPPSAAGAARPAESQPVPAGGLVAPGPDEVPPAPKPRGRKAQAARAGDAADESTGGMPDVPIAPLLDPELFPEVPTGPRPPPKPRRHRRGFG